MARYTFGGQESLRWQLANEIAKGHDQRTSTNRGRTERAAEQYCRLVERVLNDGGLTDGQLTALTLRMSKAAAAAAEYAEQGAADGGKYREELRGIGRGWRGEK